MLFFKVMLNKSLKQMGDYILFLIGKMKKKKQQ